MPDKYVCMFVYTRVPVHVNFLHLVHFFFFFSFLVCCRSTSSFCVSAFSFLLGFYFAGEKTRCECQFKSKMQRISMILQIKSCLFLWIFFFVFLCSFFASFFRLSLTHFYSILFTIFIRMVRSCPPLQNVRTENFDGNVWVTPEMG